MVTQLIYGNRSLAPVKREVSPSTCTFPRDLSAPKIIRPYWLFVYMALVPYKRKLGKGIKISPGEFVLFQKTQR